MTILGETVLGRHEQDGVLYLRLERPERLNALNDAVLADLTSAVGDLSDNRSIRVVVLEGEGRAFSAGADLYAANANHGDVSWTERRHRAGRWQRLLDRIEELPQITIAALHGHCIGGAALLAVACDLRIGDPTLQVRIPEIALGIPLTWGGVPRLAREIGLPLTRDLTMTGRTLSAEDALSCGFIQRLTAPGALQAAVDTTVMEVMAMPAAPLTMTKALTAALGRERTGIAAWADADILSWSIAESDAADAAATYMHEQHNGRK